MRRLTVLLTVLTFTGFMLIACSDSGTGPNPDNGGDTGGDNGDNDGSETTTYTVDVSASEGGSVSPSGSSEYEEGETVELQATPNDEYLFTEWTGDIESSDNPLSLTVDQNYSVTANFEKKTYALTTNTEGEGAVEEKVVQEKSTDYEHGTVVELTANPAEGYKFVEWQGDVTGTENPQQVTVDSPKEVTAVFEKKSYKLTVNTQGEGAVSEEVVQAKEYDYGTTVKLTANPSEGWEFAEWQGDITGTENPEQITIDEAKEVTAVFEKKSYALTVNTDGNGSVTKSPDQSTYAYGTTVELEANPADGHKFVEWTGAIATTDNPVEITVDEEENVTAVFEEEQAKFYLAENGVTIKCEVASVGDTGTINGVTYTKRSADLITTDNAPTTCTSGITDMSQMFESEGNFNGDISHWDVSSVTNMSQMFYYADVFNGNISNWDVSAVTNMHRMFTNADAFNQDLNSWDVSNVTDMSVMFSGAANFNGDISSWNVSSVTNMKAMFRNALSFNSDISNWDVSSVTDMSSMFSSANNFNADISGWDVLSVTDMSGMFKGATSFDQNIGLWAVSNVTDMSSMFYNTDSFDHGLNDWDVSNVESMASMFRSAPFDRPLSNWNVSSVTNMENMFRSSPFNQDISGWCVENIYSEPEGFDGTNTWDAMDSEHLPEWGTCPE